MEFISFGLMGKVHNWLSIADASFSQLLRFIIQQ